MTPPQIPSIEPVYFVGGDTIQWTKLVPDYPPTDGWTLKYRLVGVPMINGGNPYASSLDPNGNYLITIPPADTAGVVSDAPFRLLGWVDSSSLYPGDRHAVHESIITILGNRATAGYEDLQTDNERELILLNAAIQDRLDTGEGIISYSIDGRSVTLDSVADAYTHRGILRGMIWREQNRGRSFPVHQAVGRRATR